ncbi:MAG: hypothetical protein WA294_20475 [Acidobacteriaceae bacterium]
MTHLLQSLVNLEPVFLLLAAVAFFKSGASRRFPALTTYFVLRGVFLLGLDTLLWRGEMPKWGSIRYTVYFYGYWLDFLVCAIAIFFVVQEIFKQVMEPVPGLRRLGLLTFRWISIVSLVVSVGAVVMPAEGRADVPNYFLCQIGPHLGRCVSILELCLLAFLALSIHTLGRSFRSRLFGIGLGFGLQAAADLVTSALISHHPVLASSVNLFDQIVTTVVLLTWTAYFMIPEPSAERSMIILPPTSVMARWNALARGIGQTPELAAGGEPTGFFLQDIEGVVDRVLAKNPVVASR